MLGERDLVSVLGRKWALLSSHSMCFFPPLLESFLGEHLWKAPGFLPDLYENSWLKQLVGYTGLKVVESLSLEVSKEQLNVALSALLW